MEELNPLLVLKAYLLGVFPMARSAGDNEVLWVAPEKRGIIPLEKFHIPKKLKKVIKKHVFDVRFNQNFEAIIDYCAEVTDIRQDTWINKPIRNIYIELYNMGFAHSVECLIDDKIVGGLYGVSLGGAFFGESMFTRESNASKVALCYLTAKMKACGFTLLDTQFLTKHLEQFGAIEIPKNEYIQLLNQATELLVTFNKCSNKEVDEMLEVMMSSKYNEETA